MMPDHFFLGEVRVDVRKLSLVHPQHAAIVLQNKPIEVLHFLAKHYPRLVSRDEIIAAVWAGNHYVGEKALTNVIWQLRQQFKALQIDDIITTIRKHGYRLELAPRWQTLTDNQEPAPSSSSEHIEHAEQHASVATANSDGTEHTQFEQANNKNSLLTTLMSQPFRLVSILLVVLLILVAWRASQQSAAIAAPYTLSSVLAGHGRVMHPNLAPDKQQLVFSWQKLGQTSQLYLQSLSRSEQPRQLTFSHLQHGAAVWSTNGEYLYYSASDPKNGRCWLKQLAVVTLQTEIISDCWYYGRVYLDVSADGRYLAFTGYRDGDGQSLYLLDLQNVNDPPKAWSCPAFCEGMVRDVAFSADGRYIALTRRFHRLSEDIFLYDLYKNTAQQLTFGEEDIIGVRFHPDSQRLVYAAFQHGQRHGYVMDLASSKVTPLQVPNFGGHSAITTDGEVFFHQLPHALQLAYIPWQHDVSAGVFPLTASNHRFEMVHYSETRNAVTYVTNASGTTELWLADQDMQNAKQLTRLASGIKYPQWSHSGDYIVFVTRLPSEAQDRIMILEVDTGKLSQLDTGMQWHSRPSWQSDDQAVLFSSAGQLYKYDLQLQQLSQLTEAGGLFAQAIPNGTLLFTKGLQQGLWQRQPDGTEQQLISGDDFSTLYAWSHSDGVLAFLHHSDNQLSLAFYDLGAQQRLSRIVLPQENITMYNSLSFAASLQRVYLELEPLPRIDLKVLTHPLLQ